MTFFKENKKDKFKVKSLDTSRRDLLSKKRSKEENEELPYSEMHAE